MASKTVRTIWFCHCNCTTPKGMQKKFYKINTLFEHIISDHSDTIETKFMYRFKSDIKNLSTTKKFPFFISVSIKFINCSDINLYNWGFYEANRFVTVTVRTYCSYFDNLHSHIDASFIESSTHHWYDRSAVTSCMLNLLYVHLIEC